MMATDPVCKMQVDETRSVATAEHKGIRYFFCSEGCKTAFVSDPGQYLNANDEDRGKGDS